MKKLVIENWNSYGDYLLFANMVDEIGEWIMLQIEGYKTSAIGKESSLKKFSKLLTDKKIPHTILEL